jgi:hypothetical protein
MYPSKSMAGIACVNMAIAVNNENGKVKVCKMGNGLGFAYGSIGGLVGGLPCILLAWSELSRHFVCMYHECGSLRQTKRCSHLLL